MVLYPEAMRKAQAEIDAVVGRSRLPNFDDRKDLPYVQAMIREVFRWRNIGEEDVNVCFPLGQLIVNLTIQIRHTKFSAGISRQRGGSFRFCWW